MARLISFNERNANVKLFVIFLKASLVIFHVLYQKHSPWQSHSVQKSPLTWSWQQSKPSNLQTALLVLSLQKPSPTNTFCSSLSPVLHSHREQWSLITHGPQQSPPSKLHFSVLDSSLQKPLAINVEKSQPEY